MPDHTGFSPGNWLALCDRCGRTYRASRLIMDGEFPGLRVCVQCWDMKHPQELIRPIVNDGQPPPWTRPEPPWVFVNQNVGEDQKVVDGYMLNGTTLG